MFLLRNPVLPAKLPSERGAVQARSIIVEILPTASAGRTIQTTPSRHSQRADILSITVISWRAASVILTARLWPIVRTELKGRAILGVEARDAASLFGSLGALH